MHWRLHEKGMGESIPGAIKWIFDTSVINFPNTLLADHLVERLSDFSVCSWPQLWVSRWGGCPMSHPNTHPTEGSSSLQDDLLGTPGESGRNE